MKTSISGFLAFLISSAGMLWAERPNIVLIYLDDWSWAGTPVAMDDSMPNSRMPILQMPNLERLADEGMKFSNAYGAPQCAPARVSVQTGQSAARSGFTLVLGKTKDEYYDMRNQFMVMPLIPNVSDAQLDPEALTIPKVLQPLGYVSAHFGKWHMYSDPGDAGYASHDGETTNSEGNTIGKSSRVPEDLRDPKLMFSITQKSIAFMKEQVAKGNPFFLQISHYAMHEGKESTSQSREKYVDHPLVKKYYAEKGRTADDVNRRDDPACWLGMGDDLDRAIGAVLETLSSLGIEQNTYVIAVSDNGYRHKELLLTEGMTQPFHGSKWWAWEGGIRVPMIVRGPGIAPDSVFEANVVNYDFLPTFLDWAGGDPSQLEDVDGVSLAGYLAGREPEPAFVNRPLYFHLPHYREEVPHSAIISGNSKVIHFYERPGLPMLFDLENDPGEVRNIAKQHPEKHRRLFDQMMQYLAQVDARFPKPNPDFDLAVYKKHQNYERNVTWGPFEGERPLAPDEQ